MEIYMIDNYVFEVSFTRGMTIFSTAFGAHIHYNQRRDRKVN